MHLIPGVTGIVLCSAAVLVGPWRKERASAGGRARLAIVVVGAVAVVFAAVLVGRAALAHRYVDQGQELLASDPAAAVEKARSSLDLNDEALPAYYLEAAAWARLGDYARARAAARRGRRARAPRLRDLRSARRPRHSARRRPPSGARLSRALRLNPRNEDLAEAVAEARRKARRG